MAGPPSDADIRRAATNAGYKFGPGGPPGARRLSPPIGLYILNFVGFAACVRNRHKEGVGLSHAVEECAGKFTEAG